MGSIDSYKDDQGRIAKKDIMKIIPYGESFLYIDRVLKLDKKGIIAEKDVRKDEYWTEGHFKDFPIMPGALIVEGLGQAATMLVRYNLDEHEKYEVLAYKIRAAKFSRPTFPGHTLRLEARLVFKFRTAWFVKGIAYRNDKEVARVKIVLATVEKDKFRAKK